VTLDEWKPIARRIGKLWGPPMDATIAEEYFAVLADFPATAVMKAVTAVAKAGPRSFRPDVGTLHATAEAKTRAAQQAQALPEGDPLSAEEHEAVLASQRKHSEAEMAALAALLETADDAKVKAAAEIARARLAEQRRRAEAVVSLLHATGYQIPLAELPSLMATTRCSAEEFGRRLVEQRRVARTASAAALHSASESAKSTVEALVSRHAVEGAAERGGATA
jgi:hypothetical protein